MPLAKRSTIMGQQSNKIVKRRRRADYLKSWWDVVNWNEVNKRFQ